MDQQPSLWEQADFLAAPAEPPGRASAALASASVAAAPAAMEPAVSLPGQPLEAVSLPATRSLSAAGPAATPAAGPAPTPSLPPLASAGRRAPAAPERILILDTETTALRPEDGGCIEVGAVLFHVPSRAVLQQLSFLLPTRDNPAEAINGIPAAVTRLSQPLEAALAFFAAMVASAEAVVAHNAAFDRQWFSAGGALPDLGLPWICSMEEIRWPAERQLRATPSVRDRALAYGVPVWAAHRALTDCQYLVHVFERCEELEELLVAAREPRLLYRARLAYAQRHLAKEAGFRWNAPVPGAWSRRLSQREVDALPFPVVAVEEAEEEAVALPHSA